MESGAFSLQKLPLSSDELVSVAISEVKLKENKIQVSYQNQNGCLYAGDSLMWLKLLEENSVDLIFADPPYNLNKADWDNFESQQVYIEWSLQWIEQASRILKPNGSLYICGFSEILADLRHPTSKFFKSCRWLVWHYKNKANLGNDWGRSHESILHFRKSKKAQLNIDSVRIPYGAHTLKYPSHPQAETSQYGNGKSRDNWFLIRWEQSPKMFLIFRPLATGWKKKPNTRRKNPKNYCVS